MQYVHGNLRVGLDRRLRDVWLCFRAVLQEVSWCLHRQVFAKVVELTTERMQTVATVFPV